MSVRSLRRSIALVRTAIGIGALLAPHQTGRLFGMDMASNVGAPFFARLYGSRQLLMAAPVLLDVERIDQATIARWGMHVDCADTVAALAASSKGYLPLRAAVTSGAVSVLSAVVGGLSLRE